MFSSAHKRVVAMLAALVVASGGTAAAVTYLDRQKEARADGDTFSVSLSQDVPAFPNDAGSADTDGGVSSGSAIKFGGGVYEGRQGGYSLQPQSNIDPYKLLDNVPYRPLPADPGGNIVLSAISQDYLNQSVANPDAPWNPFADTGRALDGLGVDLGGGRLGAVFNDSQTFGEITVDQAGIVSFPSTGETGILGKNSEGSIVIYFSDGNQWVYRGQGVWYTYQYDAISQTHSFLQAVWVANAVPPGTTFASVNGKILGGIAACLLAASNCDPSGIWSPTGLNGPTAEEIAEQQALQDKAKQGRGADENKIDAFKVTAAFVTFVVNALLSHGDGCARC